jgi:hypothetical protein
MLCSDIYLRCEHQPGNAVTDRWIFLGDFDYGSRLASLPESDARRSCVQCTCGKLHVCSYSFIVHSTLFQHLFQRGSGERREQRRIYL